MAKTQRAGNSNVKQTSAPANPVNISITRGEVSTQANNVVVPLHILLTTDDKPVIDQVIFIHDSVSVVKRDKTDTTGRAHASVTIPLSQTHKIQTFTVYLHKRTDFATIEIDLREDEMHLSENPVKIFLEKYDKGKGNYSVYLRVLGQHAVGLSKKVYCKYLGLDEYTETDSEGNKRIAITAVPEGKEEVFTANVSGIEEQVKLTLKHKKPLEPLPSKFFWKIIPNPKWWLGTNNGRAIVYIVLAILGWIFFPSIVEFGTPILAPNSPGLDQWPVFWWVFLAGWTVFSIIYAPLSLREEAAEGLDSAWDAFREQFHSNGGDPLIERLMNWGGTALKTVKAKPAETTVTEVRDNVTFKNRFITELGSDFITHAFFAFAQKWFR